MLPVFADQQPPGYDIRWVSSLADGNGNGTSPTIGGANGAWTLAQAFANATVGQLCRVMDDGTYQLAATLVAANLGGTKYIVLAGHDNQNGPNSNHGRPRIDLHGYYINMNTRTGWWLENLEITNGPNDAYGSLRSCRNIFWNCTFSSMSAGVHGGWFALFGCRFHSLSYQSDPAMAFACNGPMAAIGCTFENLDANGLLNIAVGNRLIVIGCLFRNISQAAICDAGTGSIIALNTFYACNVAVQQTAGAQQITLNILAACTTALAGSATQAGTLAAGQNVFHGNTADTSQDVVNSNPITADPQFIAAPDDLRPGPTGAAFNLNPQHPFPAPHRCNAGAYQGQAYAGPWSQPHMREIALNEPSPSKRDILFHLLSATDGQTPLILPPDDIVITITLPGGAPSNVPHPAITDLDQGWYRLALTPAQVATPGLLLLTATAPGAINAHVEVLITSTPTDAARAAAAAAAIGTPNISVKSPFPASGEMQIQRGDDYTGEAAILRTWRNYAGHEPTGARLLFIATPAPDYEGGTPIPVLQKDFGDILSATIEPDGSTTLAAALEFTEAEIAMLAPTPPANELAYYYQIALETQAGLRTTLERGRLTAWAAAD